jgi:hypothetical protein
VFQYAVQLISVTGYLSLSCYLPVGFDKTRVKIKTSKQRNTQ